MGYHGDDSSISDLEGNVITEIETNNNWGDIESIYFECGRDKAFQMYHMQSCCESVYVYKIEGSLEDLVGSVINHASSEVMKDWPCELGDISDRCGESFTVTRYTITNDKGNKVVIWWLGTSNGYYSESVYFSSTHPRMF